MHQPFPQIEQKLLQIQALRIQCPVHKYFLLIISSIRSLQQYCYLHLVLYLWPKCTRNLLMPIYLSHQQHKGGHYHTLQSSLDHLLPLYVIDWMYSHRIWRGLESVHLWFAHPKHSLELLDRWMSQAASAPPRLIRLPLQTKRNWGEYYKLRSRSNHNIFEKYQQFQSRFSKLSKILQATLFEHLQFLCVWLRKDIHSFDNSSFLPTHIELQSKSSLKLKNPTIPTMKPHEWPISYYPETLLHPWTKLL